MLIRKLTILFLAFIVIDAHSEIPTEEHRISLTTKIANQQQQVICGAKGRFVSLDGCLQTLIDSKKADRKLRITLAEGLYYLNHEVLIHNRSDIEIIGGSSSAEKVVITHPNDYRKTNTLPTSYFSFLVIDSNNITFSNFTLNGNASKVSSQRAFGICGLEKAKLNTFRFLGLRGQDYSGYFAIIGQALEDAHFSASLPSSVYWAVERIKKLGKTASCSGIVQNIDFRDNILDLRNVGFYYAPYSAMITKDTLVNETNWRTVRDQVANQAIGINIKNNTFRVHPSVIDKSDSEFHSFIKMHYTNAASISNNTFFSATTKKLFRNGAMLNLAAGMKNTQVSGNTFIFNNLSDAKKHGINIQSSFLAHTWYGIGAAKISPPVEATSLIDNVFLDRNQNGDYKRNTQGVRIFDCCSNEKVRKVASPSCTGLPVEQEVIGRNRVDTIPLCSSLDKYPNDKITLLSQYRSDISYTSADEVQWISNKNRCYPLAVECRKNVSIFKTE